MWEGRTEPPAVPIDYDILRVYKGKANFCLVTQYRPGLQGSMSCVHRKLLSRRGQIASP